MAPAVSKPPPPKPAGRSKNARPPVVPVIPLPLVQKQQQERQQRQQKQQQQRELERNRQEKKENEEEKALSSQADRTPGNESIALSGDKDQTVDEVPAIAPTSANIPTSPLSTPTPQTAHETTISVPSPVTKTPQSSATAPADDPVVSPFVLPAAPLISPPTTVERHVPATKGEIVLGQPPSHTLSAPASSGLPPNGHAAPDFVFPPHSRSGSAARHRGPPARHAVNLLHLQHPQYPGFHQTHPSNSSITFGAFHDSNNVSPAPASHGPLPPPPGLMGGPQFIPYVPNMGPGEWPGPPGVPLAADVNGFTPTTAGFNPSTPGSFHSSHSPDNAVDGAGFGHQVGPFPLPGPNGHLPLRNNDSMSSMLSPPFFPPSGFPNVAPPERYDGRDGVPNRVIDFQFVHHLQQHLQHNFDNPQTADCHLFLHFPKDRHHTLSNTAATPESGVPDQQHVSTTMFAGHQSALAQSYTVGQLLRSDVGTMHTGPFSQPVLALHMKIEDPYISMEAAVQALRSLYGHPLADVTFGGAESDSQTLDKALANMTAGFIFMLDHVEKTGAEQAERLIGWDTVEKLFAYTLNGASFPNVTDSHPDLYGLPYPRAEFRYGRGAGLVIRRLLSKAVNFVVQKFPGDFDFNSVAADTADPLSSLCRFPTKTASKAIGATTSPYGVDVDTRKGGGNGDAAHLRSAGSVSLPLRATSDSANAKQGSSRSSQIVFGDFAPRGSEPTKPARSGINGVHGSFETSSVHSHTDATTVLSRILVNLPFGYLKYILEHPELGVSTSTTATTASTSTAHDVVTNRNAFVRSVLAERERRRQQVLDGVHAGLVLGSAEKRDAVLGRIQRPTPPLHRDHPVVIDGWDVLGWKELWQDENSEVVRVWEPAEASR